MVKDCLRVKMPLNWLPLEDSAMFITHTIQHTVDCRIPGQLYYFPRSCSNTLFSIVVLAIASPHSFDIISYHLGISFVEFFKYKIV